MAWIDGLDIPFQHYADSTFFEPGPDEVETRVAPPRSRSERLWGHPGLRPLTHLGPAPATPLLAYRWEHTDRAPAEQLELEAEGYPATVDAGHAAVRYVNPATGGDACRRCAPSSTGSLPGRAPRRARKPGPRCPLTADCWKNSRRRLSSRSRPSNGPGRKARWFIRDPQLRGRTSRQA